MLIRIILAVLLCLTGLESATAPTTTSISISNYDSITSAISPYKIDGSTPEPELPVPEPAPEPEPQPQPEEPAPEGPAPSGGGSAGRATVAPRLVPTVATILATNYLTVAAQTIRSVNPATPLQTITSIVPAAVVPVIVTSISSGNVTLTETVVATSATATSDGKRCGVIQEMGLAFLFLASLFFVV